MYRDEFMLEGSNVRFVGETDGSVWNGFANPLFDHETALRVLNEVLIPGTRESGEWDAKIAADGPDGIDVLFTAVEGNEEYVETFPRIDGLYGFGWGWCWYGRSTHPAFFEDEEGR